MNSIITVTFSPCIDKNIVVPKIVSDKKLRCESPFVQPGGGGINVATVMNRLGLNTTALFVSGGYAGAYLRHLLDLQHIPYVNIDGKEETRENIVVLESSTNKQFRFNMPPAKIYENEWDGCLNTLRLKAELSYLVISGSMPPDFPPAIFEELAVIARMKNSRLIFDTSGEALKSALSVKPFLIKPSLSELASLIGAETLAQNEAEDAAKSLIKKYDCKHIVISLGENGAMMVSKNATHYAKPPFVKVLSTVGAGDSMVAGIVFAMHRGMTPAETIRFGVACGTAATLNPGTELCHRKDAEELFAKVNVQTNKTKNT